MERKKSWKEIPIGGVILEAGNSEQYLTGTWRNRKPIFHSEKCTHCLTCWIYCPDSSIIVEEKNVKGIKYNHCKGCGICANHCPLKDKAITMVDER
jgi:pyruvate ferredoxin oxidoreductase delta subunit